MAGACEAYDIRVNSLSRVGHIWREGRAASHVPLTVVNLVLRCFPPFVSGYVRGRLYRLIGMDIDRTAFIMGNIEVVGGTPRHVRNIRIERGVKVGTHVTINCDASVLIAENVTVGPYARIYTTSHDLGPGSQRCLAEVVTKPVVIEKGSWLAVGSTVLPGVTIGHGSVVGAGAVVDKDVPPDSYVVGVPGTIVRKLPLGHR